jgi:hypothetical protein
VFRTSNILCHQDCQGRDDWKSKHQTICLSSSLVYFGNPIAIIHCSKSTLEQDRLMMILQINTNTNTTKDKNRMGPDKKKIV